MFGPSNEELADASPSMFDAHIDDVRTTIEVLRNEADSMEPCMEKEMLEATALYFEEEVMQK